MTKVINLIGAPSTGKSTLMAELFFLMKKQNLNCEMVQEWVKNLIWQNKTSILCNQHYIITEQYKSIKCLQDKVDYIILDTSLVNYIYYNNTDVKNVCNREKTEEYALKLLDEFDTEFVVPPTPPPLFGSFFSVFGSFLPEFEPEFDEF